MLRGLIVLALCLCSGLAFAQVPGCPMSSAGDPPRQVYRCASGLLFEVEAAAAIGVRSDFRGPRDLELNRGAVLIEAPQGSRFQILTPHAIASVRGTVFIVDVSAQETSVFVVEGRVSVERRLGTGSVVLEDGEGVDVTRNAFLEVRTWPAARVERLLARFSR